ncbi:MAG: cupredoxin domain-containing protein [Alphaproteobacteria bacterium]|jgi:plastocyanin|nr:cupredoxin domain-containing protein [Alphaproteobacteria bacterium]
MSFRHKVIAGAVLANALALAALGALAADFRVGQKDQVFTPDTVTLSVGQSLNFVNDDDWDHNVYSESSGNAFDIGLQAPGAETSVAFDTPGQVLVLCRIHPKMKLEITVSE